MKRFQRLIYILPLLSMFACEPYIEPDLTIPTSTDTPSFTAEVVAGEPNKVVITDVSTGFFSRVWTCDGGTPNRSVLESDTILYTKMGTYTIELYGSAEGGSGTAKASQEIFIAQDLVIECDSLLGLLTGGCESVGKGWTFSTDAGAISVGPNPYSTEWFSSTANSLDGEQYNDVHRFYFEGNAFAYENGGLTVDPCNGYTPLPLTPDPAATWNLIPGGGISGEDRIQLSEGSFMGVSDSGPWYDILTLTENELVVHGPLLPCTSGTEGYFTLRFVKAD